MKKIAVSLLLGVGALCLALPANAEGVHAKKPKMQHTASVQKANVSSHGRHLRRVHRASARMYDSYAFAPEYGAGFRSDDPYYSGDGWGGPYGYDGGYDSYAYAPGPYVGAGYGGYDPYYSRGYGWGGYGWGPGFSFGFGPGLGYAW